MERTVVDIFEKSNGAGWIHIEHLPIEGLGSNVKMYAKVSVDVAAGIGFHQHQGDGESYVILEGKADYIDHDGSHRTLLPGDATVTADGCSHGIYNAGDTSLVFMALIIKNDKD